MPLVYPLSVSSSTLCMIYREKFPVCVPVGRILNFHSSVKLSQFTESLVAHSGERYLLVVARIEKAPNAGA